MQFNQYLKSLTTTISTRGQLILLEALREFAWRAPFGITQLMPKRVLGPRQLGAWGEGMALRSISKIGWIPLAHNWRCSAGEIDIVAVHYGKLHFIEIKSRALEGAFDPRDAVDREKSQRLLRLAQEYVWHHRPSLRARRVKAIGFDLIALSFSRAWPRRPKIEILEEFIGYRHDVHGADRAELRID